MGLGPSWGVAWARALSRVQTKERRLGSGLSMSSSPGRRGGLGLGIILGPGEGGRFLDRAWSQF